MARKTFQEASRAILSEIEEVLTGVREEQVEGLLEAVSQAGAVFVTGEGRSGLVARCFATRLAHLGLSAHVVGETASPPLGKDDLLVAVSGTGESEVTCARARLAGKHGARVAALTGAEGSTLASRADLVVVVPAASGAGGGASGSVQFGGSLFEQSALVALDAVVLELQERLGVSGEEMAARHATVE